MLKKAKGKTYLLIPREAASSAIPAAIVGAFVPIGGYEYLIYEKMKKIGEFPAVVLEEGAWDAYQYPMIQSQE